MKELTKAEEEIMQVFWKLKKGTIEDIQKELNAHRKDDEKLAYNTISAFIKILEDKNFIRHKSYGKTHEYFPIIKELTKAEEEIMQVLWKLKKGFAKDVQKELNTHRKDDEKLAYNTVSTFIRILEEKGFIGHTAYGKTHEYFPLIERNRYSNFFLNNFMGKYFNGSFETMVSFFVKQNDVDLKEFETLMKQVESELKEEKEDI